MNTRQVLSMIARTVTIPALVCVAMFTTGCAQEVESQSPIAGLTVASWTSAPQGDQLAIAGHDVAGAVVVTARLEPTVDGDSKLSMLTPEQSFMITSGSDILDSTLSPAAELLVDPMLGAVLPTTELEGRPQPYLACYYLNFPVMPCKKPNCWWAFQQDVGWYRVCQGYTYYCPTNNHC